MMPTEQRETLKALVDFAKRCELRDPDLRAGFHGPHGFNEYDGVYGECGPGVPETSVRSIAYGDPGLASMLLDVLDDGVDDRTEEERRLDWIADQRAIGRVIAAYAAHGTQSRYTVGRCRCRRCRDGERRRYFARVYGL